MKVDKLDKQPAVKFDSGKIFIPMLDVEIVSPTFMQTYQRLYQSGYIDSVQFLESEVYPDNSGIKFKIAVRPLKFSINEPPEKYLVIMITAKMLGSDYFTGINQNNITIVYQYIISRNIVSFSYDTFLNAAYTDIDFCVDFRMKNQAEFMQHIQKSVVPGNEKYLNIFKKVDNQGIEFNARAKATPTKPFIKIYNKTAELTNNSTVFYSNYLSNNKDIDNGICRVEITLKNAKFRQRYKFPAKDTTLMGLLSAIEDQPYLHELVRCYFAAYMSKTKRKMKDQKTLTQPEKMQLHYIQKLIQYGESEAKIINDGLKQCDSRATKLRQRLTYTKLFALLSPEATEQLEQNNLASKEVDSALQFLGLFE